jgi:hypothetical protein
MNLASLNESEKRKLAAWGKALPQAGYDTSMYRKDRFGTWIAFSEYGKTTTYGWEIDHEWPLSRGGLLGQQNESATHWKNNRVKSNNFIG